MTVGRHVSDLCASGMAFTACLGAAFAPELGLALSRQPNRPEARGIRLPALLRLRRRRVALKKTGSD